jgi:branched-chain amino acid transport system substrate-binding protein
MNVPRRNLIVSGVTLASLVHTPTAFGKSSVTDSKEILIGQSAILKGPLATPVLAYNAGANLFFSAINSSGGVNGRSIRLISLDDGLSPDTAVANYKRLLTQTGVFAFFGAVGSATVTAAVSVLKESGAPLIGNFALSDSARRSARGAAYFIRATYRREAEVLVEHMVTIGIAKIGIATLANPGGDEVAGFLKAAIAKSVKGGDTAATVRIANDGSNIAAAAKTLAAASPQAVVMFLGGSLYGDLMQAMSAENSKTTFYGMSTVAADRLGGALASGRRVSR